MTPSGAYIVENKMMVDDYAFKTDFGLPATTLYSTTDGCLATFWQYQVQDTINSGGYVTGDTQIGVYSAYDGGTQGTIAAKDLWQYNIDNPNYTVRWENDSGLATGNQQLQCTAHLMDILRIQ